MAHPEDWLGPVWTFVASQEQLAKSNGDILVIFDITNPATAQRYQSAELCEKSALVKQLCAGYISAPPEHASQDSDNTSTTTATDTNAVQRHAQVQYVLYVDYGSMSAAPASSTDITCPFRGPPLRDARPSLMMRQTFSPATDTKANESPATMFTRLLQVLPHGEADAILPVIKVEGPAVPNTEAKLARDRVQATKMLWTKAYRICLRMIIDGDAPELSTDAMRVNAIVQVAQHLSAIAAIQSPLNDQILDWTENGDLWRCIHDAPDLWARIGFTIKRKPVFVEAMKHLIGGGKHDQFVNNSLPPAVTELVYRKRQELRAKWRAFERKLLYLLPKKGKQGKKAAMAEAYRLKGADPITMEHHVYRIAREWFIVHFRHLAINGNQTNDGPETELCTHGTADCYTYAGLIRIFTGRQPFYLGLSGMRERIKPGMKGQKLDMQLESSLEELKQRVARYAAPLHSTLKLDAKRKNGLRYLTCIEFGPNDIPWLSPDNSTTKARPGLTAPTSIRLMGLMDDKLMSEDESDETNEEDSNDESDTS